MIDHKPMTEAELRAARVLVPRLLDEIDSLRAELRKTDLLEAAKRIAQLCQELADAIERNDVQKADEIWPRLSRFGTDRQR